MSATESLTPELLDLMEHEKVIDQGLAGFLEVGNALLAIKIGRKYRAAGYATFEQYCEKRWTIMKSHGYRLIQGAQIVERLALKLSPIGDIPLPEREAQVRELTRLPEPERADAWVEAVEAADGGQPTAAEVAEVVAERRIPQAVPKPRKGADVPPHPATFSDAVLAAFRELLDEHHDGRTDSPRGPRLLDPFAGIGGIHELHADGWDTVGVELEAEWANVSIRTIRYDSRKLTDLFAAEEFDAIATSPAYGNRLADSYDPSDPQARRSYAIDLGRRLTDGNGAGLQWGPEYRLLHEQVWAECERMLRPGGLLLLNCKDHQRDGEIVAVTGWHLRTLVELGLAVIDLRTLRTAGLPFTTAEPLSELVVAFRKGRDT